MINLEDFKKLDLRVARILAAERIESSEKLLKLQIDLGTLPTSSGEAPMAGEGLGQRQIVAGIAASYTPEDLIDKEIIVIANLEPRMLGGIESQGMLLAAHDKNGLVVLIEPGRDVLPGSQIT